MPPVLWELAKMKFLGGADHGAGLGGLAEKTVREANTMSSMAASKEDWNKPS